MHWRHFLCACHKLSQLPATQTCHLPAAAAQSIDSQLLPSLLQTNCGHLLLDMLTVGSCQLSPGDPNPSCHPEITSVVSCCLVTLTAGSSCSETLPACRQWTALRVQHPLPLTVADASVRRPCLDMHAQQHAFSSSTNEDERTMLLQLTRKTALHYRALHRSRHPNLYPLLCACVSQ